jgi:hypothetical protein
MQTAAGVWPNCQKKQQQTNTETNKQTNKTKKGKNKTKKQKQKKTHPNCWARQTALLADNMSVGSVVV